MASSSVPLGKNLHSQHPQILLVSLSGMDRAAASAAGLQNYNFLNVLISCSSHLRVAKYHALRYVPPVTFHIYIYSIPVFCLRLPQETFETLQYGPSTYEAYSIHFCAAQRCTYMQTHMQFTFHKLLPQKTSNAAIVPTYLSGSLIRFGPSAPGNLTTEEPSRLLRTPSLLESSLFELSDRRSH